MNTFITLTAIVLSTEPSLNPAPVAPAPDVELDDLELPVQALRGVDAPRPTNEAELADLLETYPVDINVANIRSYYPRRKTGYHQGTRIVYANGSADIVKETFTEVQTAVRGVARVN